MQHCIIVRVAFTRCPLFLAKSMGKLQLFTFLLGNLSQFNVTKDLDCLGQSSEVVYLKEHSLGFLQLLLSSFKDLIQCGFFLLILDIINCFDWEWTFIFITASKVFYLKEEESVLKVSQSNSPAILNVWFKELLSFLQTTLYLINLGLIAYNLRMLIRFALEF